MEVEHFVGAAFWMAAGSAFTMAWLYYKDRIRAPMSFEFVCPNENCGFSVKGDDYDLVRGIGGSHIAGHALE